ncbi:hypothetical protein B0T20DRAFT_122025 [Sordaria brevicollis]|uniref:Cyanovirin-N domain-containing protein n=1 Tax=Sordaria brevicollis TaxID=83679 RepID=A0AAE0UEY1_SORBR|nr:hypothetical protein B0T20DRAFT_122025 [Sordaria brevicollis]
MRFRQKNLKLVLAIGTGVLSSYLQVVIAAAVAAPPAPTPGRIEGTSRSNSTQNGQSVVVAARDDGGSGSNVEGGYYERCNYRPQMGYGSLPPWTLFGVCASPGQTNRPSWMDLSPCYANVDGTLIPVTDGKGQFFKTCKECDVPEDNNRKPSIMRCTCERFAGDKEGKVTEVDLDLQVHVVNNKLGCPGAEGRFYCEDDPEGFCPGGAH